MGALDNALAADVIRRSTEQPGPVDLKDRAAISQVMRARGRRGGLKGAATLNAGLAPRETEGFGPASATDLPSNPFPFNAPKPSAEFMAFDFDQHNPPRPKHRDLGAKAAE
jgi:hypothetical protein